ncbi:hypothetical protein BpHYR1_015075 [Brachionus plicatilis]|uniref:Uncharacterized protein n=1 Tax=Brachionus plicatilis TaxID=10195 RepID=A0A3M7SNA0_BRAPC|nr:hypothetical protein BpHYR1_015075 [Brachionus plicatilis]
MNGEAIWARTMAESIFSLVVVVGLGRVGQQAFVGSLESEQVVIVLGPQLTLEPDEARVGIYVKWKVATDRLVLKQREHNVAVSVV